MKLLFIFLTILIGFATCTLLHGCEILKSKRSSSVDSTAVTKKVESISIGQSSGQVSKEETKSKGEYERTTMLYNQPIKDTNIIKIYPQFTYPQQPYAVIHETGATEQTSNRTDSGWYKLIEQKLMALSDSLSKKQEDRSKQVEKETKGLGLWSIILIALGAVVVMKLLGYGFSKFTIVKRN